MASLLLANVQLAADVLRADEVALPVALERADGIGRVVLDADRQVVGFFVRPAEAIS
jgi:hypothetical protein